MERYVFHLECSKVSLDQVSLLSVDRGDLVEQTTLCSGVVVLAPLSDLG